MKTYITYLVRTKPVEGKPDKYLRETFDRWGGAKTSLSIVESEAKKFDSIREATIEASEYVSRHKTVKMSDLEIIRVECSTEVLETIKLED